MKWGDWRSTLVSLVPRQMLWCYTISFYRQGNWDRKAAWLTQGEQVLKPGHSDSKAGVHTVSSYKGGSLAELVLHHYHLCLMLINQARQPGPEGPALSPSACQVPPSGAPTWVEAAADRFIIQSRGGVWCMWECRVNCNYGNNNHQ